MKKLTYLFNMLKKHKLLIFKIVILFVFLFFYISPIFKKNIIASYPGDPYYHVWIGEWLCKNLVNNHEINLVTPDLFYPNGVNLSGGYDMPLLHLTSCLAYPLGFVGIFNFLVVIQVFLIFFSSIYVAKKYIKNPFLKISFIFVYSFSSFYLARITGHINLLSTIWGIALAYPLFDKIDLSNTVSVISAFIILSIPLLSAWQNWVNLIPVVCLLIIINLINLYKNKKLKIKIIFNLIIGGFCLVLILLPFILPMIKNYSNSNQSERAAGLFVYNSDLLSYFIPWEKTILFKPFENIQSKIALSRSSYFELYNSIDPLFMLIFLLVIIFNFSKNDKSNGKKLLLIAIIFFIFSLGPRVTISGHYLFSLPYFSKIAKYPPFSMSRTPARMGIVVVFSIYLFLFIRLDKYFERKKNNILLLSIIMIYSILTTTFFSNNIRLPHHNYLEEIPIEGMNMINENNSSKFAVLNIPLALGIDSSPNFLQLYHNKPIVSGLVSYAIQTPELLSHIERSPLFNQLSCSGQKFSYDNENDIFLYSNDLKLNANTFASYLKLVQVEYIILNKTMLNSLNCKELSGFLSTIIDDKNFTTVDENLFYKVFQVIPSGELAPTSYEKFMLATVEGSWTPVWGDNPSRWIIGNRASINIFSSSKTRIKIAGNVFMLNNAPSINKKIFYNNELIDEINNNNFSLVVEIQPGNNEFFFVSDNCYSPKELGINEDLACYSIGLSDVMIEEK